MTETQLMDRIARRDRFRRLVMQNVPLEVIADEHGISRERVRQILTDNGRDTTWLKAQRQAQQSLLVNRAVTWWNAEDSPTLAGLGKHLAMSPGRARKYLVMGGITPPTRSMPPHGTRSRYVHYGCTCDPCKAAHADYHRRYNRKRQEQDA